MSKFKIEHGASRVNLVLLKTNIEDTISQDLDLLATWSNNDRKYLVNELLRFALMQEEDFQKYKATVTPNPAQSSSNPKPASAPIRTVADAATKHDPSATPSAARG